MTPHPKNLKMRFLVADDEAGDREMLQRFLEPFTTSFDYSVDMADTLAKCQVNTYDVLLLDLNLTDSFWQSTLEQINELHKMQPKMRIVVCSGVTVPDIKEKALQAGATCFLSKDQNLYRDNAKALLIAVNVALMHSTPSDDFWPRVKVLREIVEHVAEEVRKD